MSPNGEQFSISTENLLDLLEPIEKESPSGRWVRYENKYLSIVAEKNADDPNLPMGEWERPLKQTNWKRVADIAGDLLEKETKDLEICIFLIQGWASLYGMRGLRCGLLLMYKLTIKYWDTLWPKFESSDSDARISPYKWLATKGPDFFQDKIIFFPRNEQRERSLTYLDNLVEKNSGSKSITLSNDQENKIIKKGLSEIHLSKEDTNYLKELESNALEAKTIIEKLDVYLEKKLGNESISFSKITLFIEEIITFTKGVLRAKDIKNNEMKKDNRKVSRTSSNTDNQEDTNKIENEKLEESTRLETEENKLSSGHKEDLRNQIYESIGVLSERLRAIEPHSPSSYVLRRVSMWGNMTLEELIDDIGKFDGTLKGIVSKLEKR
ncbi:MAG: type VI secretion system protein TssA [Burkholderiaceae bacterium]|nr:MAG: type VI secretion system protein TssA [Burkholderiaceae bacterium]